MVEKSARDRAASVTPEWLAQQVAEPSAAGIAATLARLIRQEQIPAGVMLPPVRQLSAVLHVSPATTSAAWSMLRKQRMVEGRGRQGTWVSGRRRTLAPERFENVANLWQTGSLDLALAAPDPNLLPDLRHALQHSIGDPDVNTYVRPAITPALRDAVTPTWPGCPESFLAVNGGYEGLRLILQSTLVPGDYVAVADPSAPRILDLLELAGARIIPVTTDQEGPTHDSLRNALRNGPAIFLYEPRASSRLGITMSASRRDQLGSLLEESDALILEDDGLGELAASSYHGFAGQLPRRTVLVRSYSKSHGPDLRIAVIGGAEEPVRRAQMFLQFGAGWTSRHIQNALAWMLTDSQTQEQIRYARTVYAERRNSMIALLKHRDVNVADHDGLTIPVPVTNAQQALLVLASHRIAADAGRASVQQTPAQIVRLSIGRKFDNPERIADIYALAARAV